MIKYIVLLTVPLYLSFINNALLADDSESDNFFNDDTHSYTRITEDIKIGSPRNISADAETIQKTVVSNSGSQGDMTQKISASVNVDFDEDILKLDIKILDMSIDSNNLGKSIDTSKLEMLKNFRFIITSNLRTESVDVEISDYGNFPSNLIKGSDKHLGQFSKVMAEPFIKMSSTFNQVITQGDKLLSYSISPQNGLAAKAFVNIFAIGRKTFNDRDVIVGNIDGSMDLSGQSIKITGIGYLDIDTGIWIYSKSEANVNFNNNSIQFMEERTYNISG